MSDANTRNRYFDDLCANPELQWMGQNTNHLPAHPAVEAAMIESIQRGEYNAYAPPLGFEALRERIVADIGAPGTEALVTEGGVAALALICAARCTPGSTFVTTDPTWKWPCQFAERHGAEVVKLPIFDARSDWRLSVAALEAAVDERTRVIYLVDPNNPLGVRYERHVLECFVAIARDRGALLIHDCTYRDFADGHTPAVTLDAEHSVVTLSFSKWLGLAGLRIGALVASPALVAEFAAGATSVLGASVVAQRAALAGLEVKREWMARVREVDAANKEMIRACIESLPGLSLPVWPSHGNFVVINLEDPELTPQALVARYLEQNIMIRQGTYHTERFGERFIKVSTSVPSAWVARFCALLPAMLERARGTPPTAPLY
ncbi:pyridoxal phosphate-dependent aminotransferase [Halotalea alkalilenta]|uniref:pyridoxal phosphate-dependent aminotransferase n=1 Tax=Halotalea alkalilenta TaxID=376489 RepID=UPI0005BAD61A|nr:pyridoxal phosphate-dependent aminotransferase [Halotalea alkalilenta]